MEKKQKRLLMLGGLRYLIPVIKAAHELGYYVITCDYLPDNIAHKYSDEYHNVSIIDKEAVLSLAEKLCVDGIMSFAVDPGVVTTAYVAEKLGLPCHPYASVQLLQNKALFRRFLYENGFNVPKAKGYMSIDDAYADIDYYDWPVIVKPVDSAGSKGVTKVEEKEKLKEAVLHAQKFSVSGEIIIEEFIEKEGYSSDTDSFSINGKLDFISFCDQYFDDEASNPYTPSAYTWPSTMSIDAQKELSKELQRLCDLLHLQTSVYNIETRVGKNGKAYIMEVSPRGGGNRLSEMLYYATGVDLIKNAVRAAVGDEVIGVTQKAYNGYWAEIILHADEDGIFQKLEIADAVKPNLIEEDLWVQAGDAVKAFNGANDAIGTLVFRFSTYEEMNERMLTQRNWLRVKVCEL
jgi:biotin carboxylase